MNNLKISDYLQDFVQNRGLCKACLKPVSWSKERLAAHKRSNCPAASGDDKRLFSKRSVENCENLKANSSFEGNDSAQERRDESNLTEAKKKEIDMMLGKFIIRTGVSFRVVESAAFKDFVTALNPAYAASMPSAKKVAGPLLDEQYSECMSVLEEILAGSENLTLVSDGWTNVKGDHLVNFCIKAPNRKPFFYRSIDTSGTSQDAGAIANEIISVVEELGAEKFASVITDNAPVMKAAWRLIRSKFPSIAVYGCAAHCLNLLIKDMLDTPENAKSMKNSEKIIKFVTNHHIVKAKYEEKRIAAKISHTLSMPVATRWFSRYTSMNNLLSSKYALIQLFDEELSLLQEISPKTASAAAIKLIKSNEFWEELAATTKMIEFPSKIIGKIEANDASLSLVYHYFGELHKHYEGNATIQKKILDRYKFIESPSAGLSFALTPQFAADGVFFNNDKVDIIGSVYDFALAFDEDTAEKVHDEMISYMFFMTNLPENSQKTIMRMSSKSYWSIVGRDKFPNLFKIAKPISEMIASSATAERTWSTFKFIHSRLRNRLTNERVEKLVFLYTNCVIFDEADKNDYVADEGAIVTGSDCTV